MSTIAQVIRNGDLSVPLCANYNAKQQLFSPALAAPNSPILIAMCTDALRWMNEMGIYTDAELRGMANYLIWLSGKFYLEASVITGSGGSVTPITPGGLTASRIDFIVSSTSFIVTGASSKTISQFAGVSNIDFIRNGISQSALSSEISYFSWNRTTLLFSCSPALQEGELVAIIPS